MATPNGLEPSTSSVTGWRANRLHHRAKFGGNNRARTCDLLLVRQMLSQLSYAPRCASSVLRTSATWFIIHINPHFVKRFFRFFIKNFMPSKSALFPPKSVKSQIFCRMSSISAGVKLYTVSQNWHSTGKVFPSSRIWVSSFVPRLISAEVTRSREQ